MTTTKLNYGDKIAIIVGSGPHADHFKVGSVAGYAAEHGDDPVAAVERAERLGHELHYAFNLGVTITAHQQEPEEFIELALGDLVEFDGRTFRIDAAPNRNVVLQVLDRVTKTKRMLPVLTPAADLTLTEVEDPARSDH